MDLKHVCRFCKKRYPCGRSLGGHIRSHLIKNSKKNSSDAHNEKPELLERGFEPGFELGSYPKKTNKVTTTKLNSSSSSSSFSTGSEPEPELDMIKSNKRQNNSLRRSSVNEDDDSNSVSSVSEMGQDEVSIAMCLIMLSRDVGIDPGNRSSLNDQFSDQILLFQANNNTKKRSKREKNRVKCSVSSTEIEKKSKNLKFTPSGSSQNGSKLKGVEVSATGFALNDHSKISSESKKVEGELQIGLKMKDLDVLQDGVASIDRNEKISQSKRKIGDNYESNIVKNDMNSELFNKDFDNKRSKFECTTCNKVFNSYQALGGHRASHKRLLEVKNSLVSKLESNDMSKDENVDANNHDQQHLIAEIGIGSSKKSNQKHECPICFRVFPSGQALGGHKRSHMLATNGNNSMISETNLANKSLNREITRDLLDLNLPPITIEEDTIATTIATASSSNSVVEVIKPYWWVDSSNHEPFTNLIEN